MELNSQKVLQVRCRTRSLEHPKPPNSEVMCIYVVEGRPVSFSKFLGAKKDERISVYVAGHARISNPRLAAR